MDEEQSWNVLERQHPACAASAVFDSTDVSFDVQDVFAPRAGVECWEPWLQRLKLVVCEDGGNAETAMMI